jgi:transcriptional regulator with XRE-family HTH domain
MRNILLVIDLQQIGKRVAAARKELKEGQLQVAQGAGVSLRTMTLLESGRATEIGYSKLVRILAMVGLELRLERAERRRPTLDELLREDASDDPDLDR